MAHYLVSFTDGSEQHIPAEKVHRDVDGGQYVFHDGGRETVALVPHGGVLSIVRMPEPTAEQAVTA